MKRQSNARVQRGGRRAASELRRALVELDERALDLLLVRLLREAGKRT
jgi:hypothetical protein